MSPAALAVTAFRPGFRPGFWPGFWPGFCTSALNLRVCSLPEPGPVPFQVPLVHFKGHGPCRPVPPSPAQAAHSSRWQPGPSRKSPPPLYRGVPWSVSWADPSPARTVAGRDGPFPASLPPHCSVGIALGERGLRVGRVLAFCSVNKIPSPSVRIVAGRGGGRGAPSGRLPPSAALPGVARRLSCNSRVPRPQSGPRPFSKEPGSPLPRVASEHPPRCGARPAARCRVAASPGSPPPTEPENAAVACEGQVSERGEAGDGSEATCPGFPLPQESGTRSETGSSGRAANSRRRAACARGPFHCAGGASADARANGLAASVSCSLGTESGRARPGSHATSTQAHGQFGAGALSSRK